MKGVEDGAQACLSRLARLVRMATEAVHGAGPGSTTAGLLEVALEVDSSVVLVSSREPRWLRAMARQRGSETQSPPTWK